MARSPAVALAAVLAVVSLVLSASVASAAIVERGTFREPYEQVSEDYCDVPGLTVRQAGVVETRYTIRTHGPDGFVYGFGHSSSVDTYTNVDTGAFVTDYMTGRGGEHRVTDNGDGTLTVEIKFMGGHEMFNEAGARIARDTGQFRFSLLFDHSGTPTDPSDDVNLDVFVLHKDTGVNSDFCAALVQAIG